MVVEETGTANDRKVEKSVAVDVTEVEVILFSFESRELRRCRVEMDVGLVASCSWKYGRV